MVGQPYIGLLEANAPMQVRSLASNWAFLNYRIEDPPIIMVGCMVCFMEGCEVGGLEGLAVGAAIG